MTRLLLTVSTFFCIFSITHQSNAALEFRELNQVHEPLQDELTDTQIWYENQSLNKVNLEKRLAPAKMHSKLFFLGKCIQESLQFV